MLFDAERVCLGSLAVISEQASFFLMAQMGEWLEEGKEAFWKCGCLGLHVPEEGKASWGTGEQHPQHPALDLVQPGPSVRVSGSAGVGTQGHEPGQGSARPHCRAGAQLSAARSCLQ